MVPRQPAVPIVRGAGMGPYVHLVQVLMQQFEFVLLESIDLWCGLTDLQ